MKEVRHKRLHTISFHLHKVKNQAQLIYGITSQESVTFGEEEIERVHGEPLGYNDIYFSIWLIICVFTAQKLIGLHTYDLYTFLTRVLIKMFIWGEKCVTVR